jgi:hypothetical protein
MGIFDRGGKKQPDRQQQQQPAEDDFHDSPVETVSLNNALAPAPAPSAAPVEEDVRPSYGIENAIQLMRALPVDQNVELVVQVIKTTLESLKVKVSDIIADAERKEKDLQSRVSNLKQQIAEFEKEIQTRREEITRLEADHSETSSVKARLQLAEKHGVGRGAANQPSKAGTLVSKA